MSRKTQEELDAEEGARQREAAAQAIKNTITFGKGLFRFGKQVVAPKIKQALDTKAQEIARLNKEKADLENQIAEAEKQEGSEQAKQKRINDIAQLKKTLEEKKERNKA